MKLDCNGCGAEISLSELRQYPKLDEKRLDKLKCPKCETRLEVGREDIAAFTPHDLRFLKSIEVGV